MLHVNHQTFSTIFLQKYLIRLPESRSCSVSIWPLHTIIPNSAFFLNFEVFLMKFYQMDCKHSPWETSPVPLTFFCIGSKNRSSGGNRDLFCPNRLIFLLRKGTGVEFPDGRNCPEKKLKLGNDTQTFLLLIF